MSFYQWIDHFDKILFYLINHDIDQRYLDPLMIVLRNPLTWIPLYIFMLYFAFAKAKKSAWLFILFSVATFALTDSLTSSVLKPFFDRARPCCEPGLAGIVRSLVDCGGKYSFPSSHAANHFGLAAFWFWSVWSVTGKKWKWLWLWAATICYAQVYVGKHYPSDILAGALFGWSIGYVNAKLFNWIAFSRIHARGRFSLHEPVEPILQNNI